MIVSLFITSVPGPDPEQDATLMQIKQLVAQGMKIKQIFFYQQGVLHAQSPYAELWQQLFNDVPFMLCSQYVEQYNLVNLTEGFAVQGLVNFFAKHWQLKSHLIQL